ncbi:MAG: hypothetical protein IH571_01360, partial [Acholeplasmataceae bacterium]|nr:hypothetical protein [Acholeplasmataceae bacterium]
MKNILNRIAFSFRFSYKNLIHFKFRAFLLILSFVTLFVTILLGISIRPFVGEYFYSNIENRYRQIDFQMRASPNSNTRYFTIRDYEESEVMGNLIEDYVPFFEISTLVQVNPNVKTYVNTMASSLSQLRKVSNEIAYVGESLQANQVMVTKSFAKTYSLSEGDELTLHVGEASSAYQIVELVEDGGLFQGRTIFLNKASSLSLFLVALNPAFGAIPPNILVNFYNTVYFDLKDGVSFDEAASALESIPAYNTLTIEESINRVATDQLIQRNVAIFNVVIFVILFAVFLVMQTTFMVFFDEKRKSFAVIDMLGGRRSFSFFVVLIEMMLFFVLSVFLSVIIANFIISYGLVFIESTFTYHLSFLQILSSSLISAGVFFMTSFYYFFKTKQKTSIEHSKDQGKESHLSPLINSLVFSLSLTSYVVLDMPVVIKAIGSISNVLQVVLSVTILFSMTKLMLFLLSKLLFSLKRVSPLILNIKILLSKKAFYQYTTVLLISFLCVFLLIQARDHNTRRMDTFESEYVLDFALTNLVSRYDNTYFEIAQMSNVEHVAKASMLQDISFTDYDQGIGNLISMEANQIEHYFHLPIDASSIGHLTRTDNLVIVLPERLKRLYDLEIGQNIMISLSPNFEEESFEIAGFFEKELGNLAFANIHLIAGYESLSNNTIFVNSIGDPQVLKNTLIDNYSKNMVFVVDFQVFIHNFSDIMRKTADYLTIVLTAMIACFLLAIFNHSTLLLRQMKDGYSRMFVLGYSKLGMMTILSLEHVVTLVLFFFSSIVSFLLLSNQLVDLVLFFGEYENIYIRPDMFVPSIFIILLVYLLTKLVYLIGVLRIKP